MGLLLVSVLSVLGRYKAILRDLSVPQIYKQMSFMRFHAPTVRGVISVRLVDLYKQGRKEH